MKKTLLLAVAILLTALSTTLNAALVLSENFDYPVGNLNVGQTGTSAPVAPVNGQWYSFSGSSNYIQVSENPLTYAGYQDAAVGKAVELKSVSGADDMRAFAPITSGSVYLSALINVSLAKTGDYVLTLGDNTNNGMYAKMYIKTSGDGFSLGICKLNEVITYGTEVYNLNQTYLVVLKYEIVAGTQNDVASLFVNPVTTAAEPDATVTASQTLADTKADATNIASANLRQGTAANAPTLTIDAIRVATTWADLFGTATPTISITPKTYVFGMVFGGESYTKTINVKGKDLKGDITVAIGTIIKEVLTPTGEVTASAATITKAQAEAEGGYDLVITLTPTDEYIYQETITLSADEATSVVVKPSWSAAIPIEVADLAALRAQTNDPSFSSWLVFRVTGEVVVSHSFTDASNKTWIYVEDATGGMTIQDSFGDITRTYVTGDKIQGIVGGLQKSFGSIFFLPSKDFDAPISQGNTITPTTVTLAELAASGSLYEGRLVKVDGVSFTNAGAVFGTTPTGDLTTLAPISQLGDSANMRLFSGVDIMGTTVPMTADIIGISTSGTGNLIAPRSLQDISVLTALEQMEATTAMWSRNQILFIDNSTAEPISIFSLSGSKIHQANGVEGLQSIELATSGLYIVKVGNRAAKVLVK